tara:strand:+ start:33 stop:233 length:201 start_codon:yes stop_codon:yes gene_type:complete
MNGPLSRLRSLIRRSADEVRAIDEEALRYQSCVQEWNQNYSCDDWCDSDRAIECKQFIEWFEETRQ